MGCGLRLGKLRDGKALRSSKASTCASGSTLKYIGGEVAERLTWSNLSLLEV